MEKQKYFPRGSPEKIVGEPRIEVLPGKEDIVEKMHVGVNIRGYATLFQEALCWRRIDEKLLRFDGTLNPYDVINLDPSRASILIEGMEGALKKMSQKHPRCEKAIRLYFGLDQPANSKFMTQEEVGRELRDIKGERAVTGESARGVIWKGKRLLRNPTIGGMPLIKKIQGN